ncbi:MAG: hypothetical protein HUJ31_03815 [Pseudomonadales bacterium]|nr:hypothetical protein [Pseudomonadales bacterium]
MKKRLAMAVAAILALGFLFGIPAVLVRVSMEDVPERSKIKVLTIYQDAINTVDDTFERRRQQGNPGRLKPLPENSRAWIELINPLGRKAPGGGPQLLPEADSNTGAIGLSGDQESVTITMPAYRDMAGDRTVISARDGILAQQSERGE